MTTQLIARPPLAKCEECTLNAGNVWPVKGEGDPTRHYDVVFIGEAPGAQEALQRRPFVGDSGKLLDTLLRHIRVKREDVFITNACMCRPPANRTPTIKEIVACNDRLKAEVKALTPKIIVAMGGTAIRAITGKIGNVAETRGVPSWLPEYNAYMFATWHPAAILHDYMLFRDLLEDFETLGDLTRKADLALDGTELAKTPSNFYRLELTTPERALQLLRELIKRTDLDYIACDIESDGFNFMTDAVLELGICWDSKRTAILPSKVVLENPEVRETLDELFRQTNRTFIWHNGKFDIRFLRHQWKCDARVDADTMLLHYALDERQGNHGLKHLARLYCGAGWYEADLKQYLPTRKTPFSAVPYPIRWEYCAYDVHYTRELYFFLMGKAQKEVYPVQLCNDVLYPAANFCANTELRGVSVDLSHMKTVEIDLTAQLEVPTKKLKDLAAKLGFELTNPNSTQQLQHVMYDLIKLPKFHGERTTAEEALMAYSSRHPFVPTILEYREISKLLGTYVKGFQQLVYPDGRVHPDIYLHGAVTGRLSIHEPPLQTVPRKQKVIKRSFNAAKGYVYAEADYDQLEVRCGAWYSGDEEMKKGFIEELKCPKGVAIQMSERFSEPLRTDDITGFTYYSPDFHSRGASVAFLVPWWTLTEDDRYNYKFVVFGVMYGRGADSLANDPQGLINSSVAQAQQYIDGFWRQFSTFNQWVLEQEALVKKEGQLVTPFGRTRRFPLITNTIWWKIQKQIRNFPIQSLASDICLTAGTRLDTILRRNDWGYVLFGVHDSLSFELKESELCHSVPVIIEQMGHPPLEYRGIDWNVEVKVGLNWGDAKPYRC